MPSYPPPPDSDRDVDLVWDAEGLDFAPPPPKRAPPPPRAAMLSEPFSFELDDEVPPSSHDRDTVPPPVPMNQLVATMMDRGRDEEHEPRFDSELPFDDLPGTTPHDSLFGAVPREPLASRPSSDNTRMVSREELFAQLSMDDAPPRTERGLAPDGEPRPARVVEPPRRAPPEPRPDVARPPKPITVPSPQPLRAIPHAPFDEDDLPPVLSRLAAPRAQDEAIHPSHPSTLPFPPIPTRNAPLPRGDEPYKPPSSEGPTLIRAPGMTPWGTTHEPEHPHSQPISSGPRPGAANDPDYSLDVLFASERHAWGDLPPNPPGERHAWGDLPPNPPVEPPVVHEPRAPALQVAATQARSLSPRPRSFSPQPRSLSPLPDSSPDPLRRMNRRFSAGDFGGALMIAEDILGNEPNHADARRIAEVCRARQVERYLERLGSRAHIPRVVVAPDELKWLALDHRAGFLLSHVDGMSSIEEVLDVSSMQELDALRILFELREQGVIDVRAPPRRSGRR